MADEPKHPVILRDKAENPVGPFDSAPAAKAWLVKHNFDPNNWTFESLCAPEDYPGLSG